MIRPRRAKQALLRGIRLQCPRCGHVPIFRGWFALLARCGGCGLRFEREQGYFVGAIYLNYAATVLVAIPGYFALDYLAALSLVQQLVLWVPFCVVFPLWFFRYSKGLWLAMDYLFDPGSESSGPGSAPNCGGRV